VSLKKGSAENGMIELFLKQPNLDWLGKAKILLPEVHAAH